jgi:hypothetical protein
MATQPDIFTPEEVHSLNGYQNWGMAHPFTCGAGHRTEHPDGEGLLIATTKGWVCPYCDYRQDWAHEQMKNGSWKKTQTYQLGLDLHRLGSLKIEFFDELLRAVLAMTRKATDLEKVLGVSRSPVQRPNAKLREGERGPFSRVVQGLNEVLSRIKEAGLLPTTEKENHAKETD